MPMLDALIVAHGQPSAPVAAEQALARFRDQVALYMPDAQLGAATLAAAGSLEAQLNKLRPNAPVYPLFMSNGWFVKTNLAGRLGNAPVEVMTPFGLDPELPMRTAQALRPRPALSQGPLLLVAHGSASGRTGPAQATERFATLLSKELGSHEVHVGYIEQAPHIRDVAWRTNKAALCLPFFAMEGAHLRDDVSAALAQANFSGELLPPVSHLPGMARHIANVISEEIGGDRPLPKAACA